MPSASPPAANRVRQIAILVSSVDAAAARQLLLHLPTEMARQVRAQAAQLGPISPAEKRAILAEFQKSAGQGLTSPSTAQSSPQSHQVSAAGPKHSIAHDQAYSGPRPDNLAFDTDDAGVPDPVEPPEIGTAPAWTKLSSEALVRFAKGERTAVVAVVVSQLTPNKAVDVLRRLPREVNRAVLQRLSHLQDIDPDATAAIDEHLAERLSEYQSRIESEQENSRRLNALLAAAPPDLQHDWRQLLGEDGSAETNTSQRPAQYQPAAEPLSTKATIAELYGDAVITTADSFSSALNQSQMVPTAARRTAVPAIDPAERADVLPFPSGNSNPGHDAVDRTFLQVEFDKLLSLSHSSLAALLSSADSQTVLLALAGSSPNFMRRFNKMLNPDDAEALHQRLQSIGSINLRDVDEAQRRIVEQAAALNPVRHRQQAA